jgi:hypothetical protein
MSYAADAVAIDAAAEARRTSRLVNRYLERQIRADEAAEAEEKAENERQGRWDCAEACRQLQERYDEAFSHFGRRADEPKASENPRDYRCRLVADAQSLLPSDHELTKLTRRDLDSLSHEAFTKNVEGPLLKAVNAEGDRPSPENTPADGSLIKRERVDSATGLRTIDYYGRESFVKGFTRPGRRLFSFNTHKGRSIHAI